MTSAQRIAGSVVLAIVAIGFVILAMGRFSGRGGGPPARPAITIEVGHDSAVAIGPARYRQFEFRLPPRLCTLTGRVEGLTGGNPEFEALVLDDDEFRRWPASHQVGSVRSGPLTVWNPQVTLVGPGRYHLVVANFGSPPVVRSVAVAARAVCP